MAKLLSQSYTTNSSKLIIVGMDDVYRRLYNRKMAIKGRLVEISLGSFPDKNSSWKYLLLSFEALGLYNPANTKIESEKSKIDSCIQAIYNAADGLPKSLTQLGSEISINSFDRTAITAYDIQSCSTQYIKRHVRRYHTKYGEILLKMKNDTCSREIINYIIVEGSGNIHHIDDLFSKLGGKYNSEDINSSITELVNSEILVQTGINNDIIFIKDLPLIHTLSVVAESPGIFGYEKETFTPLTQMGMGI
jgi:hypothetical protein